MNRHNLAAALFVTLLSLPVHAYEQPVHRAMTDAVFDRLRIDFQSRLGIDREHIAGRLTLKEHLSNGVHNEDAMLPMPRPLNHFFDPTAEAALTVRTPVCSPVGLRADRWAIESGANSHAMPFIRVNYHLALFGHNSTVRDQYLESLFLSFGHFVHLLQDMAQPEHTRNDQHLTYSNKMLFNGTSASIWETWGAENLVARSEGGVVIPPVVSLDGYPNVRLPDYESYFHTADGKGMADFANRSFVTQDTNYQDEQALGRCVYHTTPRIADTARRIEHSVYGIIARGR